MLLRTPEVILACGFFALVANAIPVSVDGNALAEPPSTYGQRFGRQFLSTLKASGADEAHSTTSATIPQPPSQIDQPSRVEKRGTEKKPGAETSAASSSSHPMSDEERYQLPKTVHWLPFNTKGAKPARIREHEYREVSRALARASDRKEFGSAVDTFLVSPNIGTYPVQHNSGRDAAFIETETSKAEESIVKSKERRTRAPRSRPWVDQLKHLKTYVRTTDNKYLNGLNKGTPSEFSDLREGSGVHIKIAEDGEGGFVATHHPKQKEKWTGESAQIRARSDRVHTHSWSLYDLSQDYHNKWKAGIPPPFKPLASFTFSGKDAVEHEVPSSKRPRIDAPSPHAPFPQSASVNTPAAGQAAEAPPNLPSSTVIRGGATHIAEGRDLDLNASPRH